MIFNYYSEHNTIYRKAMITEMPDYYAGWLFTSKHLSKFKYINNIINCQDNWLATLVYVCIKMLYQSYSVGSLLPFVKLSCLQNTLLSAS